MILRGARDGPTSLGDPTGLALGRVNGCLIRVVEEAVAVRDVVGHGILEVWIRVDAEEVASRDDRVVGAVDPSSPRVDVANGDARDASAAEGRADLADVVDDVGRLSANAGQVLDAGGRDAVQVLRADRDALDQVREAGAVLGDGGRESRDFVGDGGLTSRGPNTEKKRGARVDGGGDGARRGIGRVLLNHGVETRRIEARRADEVLSGLEGRPEIGARSVVEALDGLSRDRGHEACEGDEVLHC